MSDMAWQVTTPDFEFAYHDDGTYSGPVQVLADRFTTGVPYLFTGTVDLDYDDERTVYLAATVLAEEYTPGQWTATWTGDEPLPPVPDFEGDRLPVY